MAASKMPAWVAEKVRLLAAFPQTGVSIHQVRAASEPKHVTLTVGGPVFVADAPPEDGRQPSPVLMLRASQFLREEMPIRLAHRVAELENLPYELSSMPSVIKVKDWYAKSFQDLLEFPSAEAYGIPSSFTNNRRKDVAALLNAPTSDQSPYALHNVKKAAQQQTTSKFFGRLFGSSKGEENVSPNVVSTQSPRPQPEEVDEDPPLVVGSYYAPMKNEPKEVIQAVLDYNQQFANCLEAIKRRHDPVVSTVANGILELKEHWRQTSAPTATTNLPALLPRSIQTFLDRFYLSRIGIRMLIGQHVALHNASFNPSSLKPDYVGIICTRASLKRICSEAIEDARFICRDYFGLYEGPRVELIFPAGKEDCEFMYVPSHLHHMLFELLKNSLRAVVERYGVDPDDGDGDWPPVKVIVAEGEQDITIKIADEGGGIPRSGMPMVWTYMYTTASTPMLEDNYNKNDFKAPMAGFGYGLPISRCYARYFGGDLKLISMEGYGTDAYLHLSRLSQHGEPCGYTPLGSKTTISY